MLTLTECQRNIAFPLKLELVRSHLVLAPVLESSMPMCNLSINHWKK